MSTLSLHGIAGALDGVVRGDKVSAPGPEAASPTVKWKRKRHTLTVWLNSDGDVGVNCHEGQDPIATKDWVRERCGLPRWQPKQKRLRPKLPPLAIRIHYLDESLRIAGDRKNAITYEQFALIINDLRNIGRAENAICYARMFGFTTDDLDRAMSSDWRPYDADERGAIWNLSLADRLKLNLRRTGCIDADKPARERARRDRYNAKRRAKRNATRARVEVVASIIVPSLEPSQERTLVEEEEVVNNRGLRAEPAPAPASVECHLSSAQIPGWGPPPNPGCIHPGFERWGQWGQRVGAAKETASWVATSPHDGAEPTCAAVFLLARATSPPALKGPVGRPLSLRRSSSFCRALSLRRRALVKVGRQRHRPVLFGIRDPETTKSTTVASDQTRQPP